MDQVISELGNPDSYREVYYSPEHGQPMPSIQALSEIMDVLKSVLFPGYFGNSEISPAAMPYYLGSGIDRVYKMLGDQIRRGYCFLCHLNGQDSCEDCDDMAMNLAGEFISVLPRIRSFLARDVKAAYEGDPAAKSLGEIIFCYPSILALIHYRVAHELYHLGVDLIPRIISEMAHSKTGIDIHPGAEIGSDFFIDHGTGTVIGETCIIGNNVRLYQGVTLGAKSFPKDESGRLVKGMPRHPIVEDKVIIYSGATILGRVTIGQGSVIGGNVWLTQSVPAGTMLVQELTRTDSGRSG
nr:serine O-acetyltransferase EpsC [Desulfonatronovibrio hydrogenovorans]